MDTPQPETPKSHKYLWIGAGLLLLVVIAGVIYWWQAIKTVTQLNQNQQTNHDLRAVFDMDQKEPGTKIYYSAKFGIGFTYLPSHEIDIHDAGNKILVGGQSIEVFDKNPDQSLSDAIKGNFLAGYDPSDCFVDNPKFDFDFPENYTQAVISFPPSTDPEAPWWQNSEKCPTNYSETNGLQYFMMNKNIPDKFIFVKIGQYSEALDGTQQTKAGGYNWDHSIRILE